jgi:hypothetical protein
VTPFAEVYVAGDYEFCKSTGRQRRRRRPPKPREEREGVPLYLPTLEEISLGCLRIQATWSRAERRRRLVGRSFERVEVPRFADADFE